MINKKYSVMAFTFIYLAHATYSIYGYWHIAQLWANIEINKTLVLNYFTANDYLLGVSYAVAGAFTVYSLERYFAGQKNAKKGTVLGLAISGLLYFSGCFLIGCCGSPMLVVYLSLFGAKFLGFTKPLIALITIVSVGLSYYLLRKKGSCCNGENCESNKSCLIK